MCNGVRTLCKIAPSFAFLMPIILLTTNCIICRIYLYRRVERKIKLNISSNIEHYLKLKVADGTYATYEEAVNTTLNTALLFNLGRIDSGVMKGFEGFGYYEFEDEDIPQDFSFPVYDKPVVSIIIPVFNQYSYTRKCLWSILQYAKDVSYEIIIADDNSDDETKDIQKHIHNIKVNRNKTNLGYIRNCNSAAKIAAGKYIYFMNNDTVAQPNWLFELVNVFSIKSDAGVVGSKIYTPEYEMQECGVYMFSNKLYYHPKDNPANSMNCFLKEADYVSGCSFMTPRELFFEIGGFDELYHPAYSEDPDYCLSARVKGYKTYVQPKSKILHYGSKTYSSKQIEIVKANDKKLKNKWKDFFETRTTYQSYKLPFSAKTRPPIMFMIDTFMPEFDKHAGAKTIFQFIELFVSKGIRIKYCPYNDFERKEPYYTILTNMGVQIIEKENIERSLEKMADHVDYIFLSRPDIAQKFSYNYLKKSNAKILYYGHDLHHVRMQREFDCMKPKEKGTDTKAIQNNIDKMKSVEESALKFADFSYYPSAFEENYIKKNFKIKNVSTIPPYLYDVKKMPKHADFEHSKDLIFVGSSHGPNKKGLLWFIDKVMPVIVKKLPDIKLNIVGSSIDEEIKNKENDNIKIAGFLTEEQLQELYLKTKITIAPVLFGAGIKGKIVNSFFYSTPVVTTTLGAEGISTGYGNIYVHDNPKGYAEQVVDLYTDKSLWCSNLKGYSEIISKEYSFEKAWDIFSRQIDITPRDNDQ